MITAAEMIRFFFSLSKSFLLNDIYIFRRCWKKAPTTAEKSLVIRRCHVGAVS
jgi:hypothetical protein